MKERSEQEYREAVLNKVPDSPDIKLPVYIIAGNYREARRLADANRIPPNKWKYVVHPRDLDGSSGSVCWYGTFYTRPEMGKIHDLVKIHCASGNLTEVILLDK